MYIYKITNLINKKVYIGRTTAKKPERRWTEHKSKARRGPRTPIEFAIRKYKPKNFQFKVIYTCKENESIDIKESEFIIKHDSLSPNGYNLESYQPFFFRTKESKIKNSLSSQGIKRTTKYKYIGIWKSDNKFYAEIGKDKKKIRVICSSERIAASSYDKLALFLYGKSARINFPNKKKKLLSNPILLKKFYDKVTFKKPEEEKYIVNDSSRGKYRVFVDINGKKKQIGQYLTFELAVNAKKEFLNKL